MGFWGWALVFLVIGLLALVLYAVLGLQLWHKAKQLTAEVTRLTQTVEAAEQLMRPAAADVDVDGGVATPPAAAAAAPRTRSRGRKA